MPSSPPILYAHREDEITTLLEAVAATVGEEVTLVVPEGAILFRDALNLRLLQRETERLGKKLTLSTRDAVGISLAKKAGVQVEMPSDAEKFFEGWAAPRASAKSSSETVPHGADAVPVPSGPSPMRTVSTQRVRRGRGMDIAVRPHSAPGTQRPLTIAKAIVLKDGKVEAQRTQEAEMFSPASASPGSDEPLQPEMETDHMLERPDDVTPGEETVLSATSSFPWKMALTAVGIVVAVIAGGYAMFTSVALPKLSSNFYLWGIGALALVGAGFIMRYILRSGKRMPWGGVAAAAAVLGLIGAAVFFIKPSATVVVFPKQEVIEFEMDLVGRTDVSAALTERALVPAEHMRVEEAVTETFPAGGERDVASKARGRVTVYNTFSSVPQKLVAATRFLSESGKLFRIPEQVMVPGARIDGGGVTPGSIETEIVADAEGDAFNIPPSRFTIPGFAGTPREKGFYAESRDAMAGGFKGRSRVVEKADVDAAKLTFLPKARERLEAELKKKFPQDLAFIDGALSVTVSDVVADPAEGQPGESFTLKATIAAEALLFKEADVRSVMEPNISAHLAAKFTAVPDGQELSYTLKQFDGAQGRIAFTALAKTRTEAVVDWAELGRGMAGMNVSETKAFFARQNTVERADLSLWPFWARRLPSDPSRIHVVAGDKK